MKPRGRGGDTASCHESSPFSFCASTSRDERCGGVALAPARARLRELLASSISGLACVHCDLSYSIRRRRAAGEILRAAACTASCATRGRPSAIQ